MDGKLFFDTLTKTAAPPQHSKHEAGPFASTPGSQPALPPRYLERIRFPVGGKSPKGPFVTTSQLKAHFGLLRAFGELKNQVTDLEANRDAHDKLPSLARELEPQQRWVWFLELALERCILCDPLGYPVLPDFQLFAGSIAGLQNLRLSSSRVALTITLPWMCGSSGTRTC